VSGARYATYRECERTARIINQPQRARALFRAGALSAQPASVITAARGLCVVQRALFSLSSRCCRVARRVPRCARSLRHHAVARSRPSLATWRACEKAARADEFPISRSAFALKGVSFLEREFLLCPGSKARRSPKECARERSTRRRPRWFNARKMLPRDPYRALIRDNRIITGARIRKQRLSNAGAVIAAE